MASRIPPGFATPAVAWRYVSTRKAGSFVAFMPLPPFDGRQACAGDDRFIAETHTATELDELREICNSCPFLDHCRDWSLAHEQHNVHAGMGAAERAKIRRQLGVVLVPRLEADRWGLMPA